MLVNPLKASIFAHSYDELRQEGKETKHNNFCCFSCKALYNSRIQKHFFSHG